MKNIILLLAALILFHCGGEKNYTVEIIDGVRYVHNLAPKYEESRIGLEFLQQFGVTEGEDENYNLFRPGDIAFDKFDNIYIIENGSKTIKKFTPEGKYILTFGREGQGPGEFEFAANIFIENDTIIISDSYGRKLSFFDLEGNFQRQITRRKISFKGLKRLKNGNFIYNSMVFSQKVKNSMMHITDPEFNIIENFLAPEEYNDIILNLNKNAIRFAIDHNSNIYIAYINKNKIEKYSKDLKLLTSFSREIDLDENKDSFSYSIMVDGKSRIWVLANPYGERISGKKVQITDRDLEVYDKDGVLLFRYENKIFDGFYNSFRIIGDNLYFIDPDEMVVKKYRIVEK